jgi:heme-degrading monooxygenase HmoA
MPLISVTRLRVRAIRFLPGFLYYAFASSRQVRRAEGNLGAELLNDARKTFWTCTAWKDEKAMRAFMMTRPHRTAMAKLAEWCDEASVVHWEQATAELPDWREAFRMMVSKGRPSRVNHPSAEHREFKVPEPRLK